MKYTFISFVVAAVSLFVVACNESSTIGNNLSDETVSIIVDSNFTVTGSTQANSVVQSRTLSQLIGNIDAPGFGVISSDFVAQFMPSLDIDTAGITVADIDSVKLFLQMDRSAYVGDSLVPMGLEVYRLTKDLPYPIYSDFDPAGYYDPTLLSSATYTASSLNDPDSIKKLPNLYVSMKLPLELGRDLYTAYEKNPAVFADPETFAKDVFKGLYIRSNYGSGRISDFTTNSIRMYYHKTTYKEESKKDTTIRYVGDYFAATPEVVINNNIHYQPAAELKSMIAAGEHIIAAPAGYELELRFPAPEIIASYNKHSKDVRVLNSLSMSIPADSIANKYGIAPPPYVLLIPKNKKDEFFAKNSINDDVTSFYAEYNSTKDCYTFNMRKYLLHLLELDEITPDDYTFCLTPVQVDLELSSNSGYYGATYVVSRISPYVSKPAMVKISLKDVKIKLTFSTGKDNF